MRAEFQFSIRMFNEIFSDGEHPALRIRDGIPEGAILKEVRMDDFIDRIIFIYEGDNLPENGYITPVAERRFHGVTP